MTQHTIQAQASKNKSLIPFNFHGRQIRVHQDRHGFPWWIAADVCKVLDIKNTSQALESLDADEKTTISKTYSRAGSGAQSFIAINEPGLYSLVIRSNKPEAKSFKRWITHEVIPSIRKSGGYSVHQELAQVRSHSPEEEIELLELIFDKGLRRGIMFNDVLAGHGMTRDDLARMVHFRKAGLTQAEVGKTMGYSIEKIQAIEKDLADMGLDVPKTLPGRAADVEFLKELDAWLGLKTPLRAMKRKTREPQKVIATKAGAQTKTIRAPRPLTDTDRQEIINLYNDGHSVNAISNLVGRHRRTIYQILDNITGPGTIDISGAIKSGDDHHTNGASWRCA